MNREMPLVRPPARKISKFRKSLSKFKSTSVSFPSAIGRERMPSWLQMLNALNQAQSSILKRFTKNRVMTKRENHSWINYQNEHGELTLDETTSRC